MIGLNTRPDLGFTIFDSLPGIKYQSQARDGVWVFLEDGGPTMKRAQPSLKEDEKEVIRGKVRKFIRKSYISPPEGKVKSLIKTSLSPKGSSKGWFRIGAWSSMLVPTS
jgi:hypothetical protein